MRRILAFTFGVLVGTIVATAWAQYHNYPTVDSPRHRMAIDPHAMMTSHAHPLPVESYQAF
jgi:hypothetical protein